MSRLNGKIEFGNIQSLGVSIMKNERKTENIVRLHLSKDEYKDCIIEEQSSDSPKIDKLLKCASKKGTGKGFPEFIISSFKNNPDLIVVVECKSDVAKHESKNRDKYSDYAVDGVLLYASFLSKEFDVLAIAVSGETIKELKVSHFLHLKGKSKPAPIFSNKLLGIDSYIQGYIHSPEKFKQDYHSLLDFSKELNEELHSKKVKASQRSLLISGILMALENPAFKVSYEKHPKAEDLANALVDTISNEFKNANLQGKKLDNLKTAFSFIRTHPALSGGKNVLSDIITSIDKNVNHFIKTYQYLDVLGQFYVEFLRYANSDKGLGIVLTPPHITELFSDLARVTKDSVVYDNCAGTGGFLISAMNKMISDAKGDKNKEKDIKQKQLVGVEYQDDIFALACSNMFIHQDGKTNLIYGDCFSPKVIQQVVERKPDVGFLNPPYPNLDTDPLELEFILKNLEALQPHGTCVAIIPISCLLAAKGREYELKQKILESHTLEAVLSMPNQLFHNNDVGVVTSVLVITAHEPHQPKKKTWFGYFKDDGFKVQKHKGRVDLDNAWESVRKRWIEIFTNREEVKGLSLLRAVTAKDEWCAEAYMETDYSKLTPTDFMQELKRYAAFTIVTGK